MAIPREAREAAAAHVEIFCANQIPQHAKDEVRLEHSVRGGSITIVERRAPWKPEYGPEWSSLKVAQLRYDEGCRTWSLYSRDRNERWHPYPFAPPAPDVGPLLAEIAEDPSGIFWG